MVNYSQQIVNCSSLVCRTKNSDSIFGVNLTIRWERVIG
jgi:hypothetical protein